MSVTDQVDFQGLLQRSSSPLGRISDKSMWGRKKKAHMRPEIRPGMRKSVIGYTHTHIYVYRYQLLAREGDAHRRAWTK